MGSRGSSEAALVHGVPLLLFLAWTQMRERLGAPCSPYFHQYS